MRVFLVLLRGASGSMRRKSGFNPHYEMTAQINDTCFHQKIDFKVAGISGSGLFDPDTLAFKPISVSSACRRGHVAHYSILDGELYLTSLAVGLPDALAPRAEAGEGPELFGVLPKADPFWVFLYKGFQQPTVFTGGLLLADDFIRELYVHMGFHPAWKYRTVREVIFDSGRIIGEFDRSDEMATAREKFVEGTGRSPGKSDPPADGEIQEWIRKCFSREY